MWRRGMAVRDNPQYNVQKLGRRMFVGHTRWPDSGSDHSGEYRVGDNAMLRSCLRWIGERYVRSGGKLRNEARALRLWRLPLLQLGQEFRGSLWSARNR